MRKLKVTELFGGASPWVGIYRARYSSHGFDKWNNERVNALCQRIGCQVVDLAAYAGEFRNANVQKYLKSNHWPVPLVLHFVKIERFLCKLHAPDMQDITMAQMLAPKMGESAHD